MYSAKNDNLECSAHLKLCPEQSWLRLSMPISSYLTIGLLLMLILSKSHCVNITEKRRKQRENGEDTDTWSVHMFVVI